MDPPETHNTLTRSVSQPIEPSQYRSSKIEDLSDGREQFKRTHRRRGSEPLSRVFRKESPGERMSEPLKDECDRSSLNKELFPMGCCMTTSYQSGWLDLACGPSIDIDIVYHNHNSDMTHVPLNKNMVPSQVIVNVDAPCVLLRVFGFLARDLLSLKVSTCTLSLIAYYCITHRRTIQESTCTLKHFQPMTVGSQSQQ